MKGSGGSYRIPGDPWIAKSRVFFVYHLSIFGYQYAAVKAASSDGAVYEIRHFSPVMPHFLG